MVEVSHAYWLCRLFSRHISRMQSLQENRLLIIQALVDLNPLIGCLVACSARIGVDRQTDRQTHRPSIYCNPHCACVQRVNNSVFSVCNAFFQCGVGNVQNNKCMHHHFYTVLTYWLRGLRCTCVRIDSSVCKCQAVTRD